MDTSIDLVRPHAPSLEDQPDDVSPLTNAELGGHKRICTLVRDPTVKQEKDVMSHALRAFINA